MKKLFIILLINSYYTYCQNIMIVDNWIEYIEEQIAGSDDPSRFEEIYEELSYLKENPLDLNQVTHEELNRIPFLTDLQIRGLMDYREKHGYMVSIYELKGVDHMDYPTIQLLIPFVYIGEKNVENRPLDVNNMLKYGVNQFIINYNQTYQQKKGYKEYPDSILALYPNRKYVGEPFYHSLRYSYQYEQKIQLGMVGEKDAGEAFWNNYHKGYDYYSAHLFIKDINKLKSLAIGDYKISFGQGLIVSNDYSPGKSAMVIQGERRNNGFRRHYSTNENDFFRGIAGTLAIKNWEFSLFQSFRYMDGSVEDHTISSVKTDGLNRLVRDLEKRKTIPMQVYGENINYSTPDVHVGVTLLTHSFGKYSYEPEEKPYNLFYFRGKTNINSSVDYVWKTKHTKLYGEMALSGNGAIAVLNGFNFIPASYFSFLVLHRYYDRRYQAWFGNAFSQSLSVQNEHGVYTGIQFTPIPYWKISAYRDFFRYPWLKYGIDTPSGGKEYMVQVDHTQNRFFSWYIRYRYKEKEKNILFNNHTSYDIIPYDQQRLRIQGLYMGYPFVLKTSLEGVLYEERSQKKRKGYAITQSIGWEAGTSPVRLDLFIAYFHTDDYTTRISSYEKNMPYVYHMNTLYGRGVRLSGLLRWNIWKKLSFSMKMGYTYYPDQETIGTGLEEIEGNRKTEGSFLIQWKF